MRLKFSIVFFQLVLWVVCSFSQKVVNLKVAVQIAKENNPTLKSEKYNILITRSDSITAHLRPNPVLNNQSLQLANSQYFSADTKWADGQNRQVWWQLTKPLQWPNQRKYKIETAILNIRNTENRFAETERSILFDVASQWLEAWTNSRQLSLLYDSKRNLDSLIITNRYRLEKQVISRTDLMRTELLANQFELQIKSAQQQYKNSLQQLAMALGTDSNITIDTSEIFSYNIQLVADSLLRNALNKRTDVLTAKSDIDVANSNIHLQKSLATPQPEVGFIYNPQNTIPYLGIYATIDLPFFSRNQGEIRKSQVLKQQATQNLVNVQRQINTEVATAYNSFITNTQNMETYKSLLQQAQTILNNVKYAYLRGGTSIVDFLEAQRSWLETQQQYYDAMQQYRESYIQLLYVTGYINQLAE
jgi:cobalt-zinc-cadmium efflux system outer membrane protein